MSLKVSFLMSLALPLSLTPHHCCSKISDTYNNHRHEMIHQSSMSSQENVQRETQICNSAGKFLKARNWKYAASPDLCCIIPENSACVFFYKSDVWAAAAPPSMPAPPRLPLLRRAALDSSQLLLTMHRQHYSTAPYNNHLRMLCPKCGIFWGCTNLWGFMQLCVFSGFLIPSVM